MELKSYHNLKLYLQDVEEYLLKNEVKNNLPIGILYSLKNNDEVENKDLFLSSITDANRNILLAIMTPPKNLIIVGDECDQIDEAIDVLIDYLLNNSIEIPGIIGDKKIVEQFKGDWLNQTESEAELFMAQRVFKLEYLNQVAIAPGKFRRVQLTDLEIIKDWYLKFCQECLSKDLEEEQAKNHVKEAIEAGRYYGWEHRGKLVSVAARARNTKNAVAVNFVYTPKGYRGKGYATSTVASLSQKLLEQNYKYCCLFTDLANPTSNSIYKKIGYQPIADYMVYNFKYFKKS